VGLDSRWLSLESYDRSSRDVNERTGLLTIVCVLLGLLASVSWAGHFVRPIHRLQGVVERVASGDLTARSDIRSHDEIEQLAHAFNSMADAILHRDRELSEAKRDLEIRVTLRTQELSEQIVARDKAHTELAEAQKRLIELSRLSGMAEVATGVLHNVGNVLNSVKCLRHHRRRPAPRIANRSADRAGAAVAGERGENYRVSHFRYTRRTDSSLSVQACTAAGKKSASG